MQLIIHPYNLELEFTFTITHESRNFQPGIIVELIKDGHSGLGEASATSYYGVSVDAMTQRLEKLRPTIESATWETPEELWAFMQPHVQDMPFVQCALDMAAHDLYGKIKGQPLYQIWGLKADQVPASNYTIGMGSIDEMIAKMQKKPWPLYKIKLGADHTVETVQKLREHTNAKFRIDANTGWTADQTIEFAPLLKELGVEFIEQPLKVDNLAEQKRAFENSVLPIIADESCQVESDVEKCHGYFHGINIKLVKCGGLTPALRMIHKAKELGLKVMVGCMTESSVGISAIAQLLPLLDYVDMDGALLLKKDIAKGVVVTPTGVVYAQENGTGAILLP